VYFLTVSGVAATRLSAASLSERTEIRMQPPILAPSAAPQSRLCGPSKTEAWLE
jgi:hypothetical protein